MTLDVDKEAMIIMGVKFHDEKTFETVSYVIGSSMMSGFVPTVENIEHLKNYADGTNEAEYRYLARYL